MKFHSQNLFHQITIFALDSYHEIVNDIFSYSLVTLKLRLESQLSTLIMCLSDEYFICANNRNILYGSYLDKIFP